MQVRLSWKSVQKAALIKGETYVMIYRSHVLNLLLAFLFFVVSWSENMLKLASWQLCGRWDGALRVCVCVFVWLLGDSQAWCVIQSGTFLKTVMSKIETPASSAHGQSVGRGYRFDLIVDPPLWADKRFDCFGFDAVVYGVSWVCFSVVLGEVLCQDLHPSDPTSTSCSRMW